MTNNLKKAGVISLAFTLTACSATREDPQLRGAPSTQLDHNTARENEAKLDLLNAFLTIQRQLSSAIHNTTQLCEVSFSKAASTNQLLANIETRTLTGNRLRYAVGLQQVDRTDVFVKITDPSFDNTNAQYTMFTKNDAGEPICIESSNGKATVRKVVSKGFIYSTPQ